MFGRYLKGGNGVLMNLLTESRNWDCWCHLLISIDSVQLPKQGREASLSDSDYCKLSLHGLLYNWAIKGGICQSCTLQKGFDLKLDSISVSGTWSLYSTFNQAREPPPHLWAQEPHLFILPSSSPLYSTFQFRSTTSLFHLPFHALFTSLGLLFLAPCLFSLHIPDRSVFVIRMCWHRNWPLNCWLIEI